MSDVHLKHPGVNIWSLRARQNLFFAPTPVSQGKLLSSFLREGGYFNVIFKEILFQSLLILSGTLPKQAIYFKFIETPAAHFVAVVF